MNKRGTTYIETLIALAVFCIALMPLLSGLYIAFRNKTYAMEAYAAHLQAQQIMTVVRDAHERNADAVEALEGIGLIPSHYGVWLDGLFITGQGDLPEVNAAMDGLSGKMITVMVWAEGSEVYSYAYGVVPESG